MPGARPAIDGVAVTVPGAVPLAGLSDSQDADSVALQLIVPPPVFVTSKLCADGFAPPWVAVNDMVVLDTASTGGAGFTVSATSTVFGEPRGTGRGHRHLRRVGAGREACDRRRHRDVPRGRPALRADRQPRDRLARRPVEAAAAGVGHRDVLRGRVGAALRRA